MHPDDRVRHLILHLLVVAKWDEPSMNRRPVGKEKLTASPCPRYIVLTTASRILTSNGV